MMIIQILAPRVVSYCKVVRLCRYWLGVTLEQGAAFALASVPVLTLGIDCRALNLLTSDHGGHGRSSVGVPGAGVRTVRVHHC